MKNINYILSLLFAILSISACSNVQTLDVDDIAQEKLLDKARAKWAAEQKLQKEQDESDDAYKARVAKMFDEYYAALRAYKKDRNHKIVYGWFRGEMWKALPAEPGSFLFNIADSVDVISIWGGIEEFGEDDPRWEDLKLAQEVKGLKVLLCWQTGSSGLGLPGSREGFDKRHKGKSNVEKAIAYAQELTEHIKRLNLNGYDIDWEPTVGDHRGCGNLYRDCGTSNEMSAEPIRAFIKEMGKNFGPKQTTDYNPRNSGTMFLFDGQMEDMATRFPEMGVYFDYFIEQNYWTTYPRRYDTSMRIEGMAPEKYLLADEFERYDGYKSGGGKCGTEPCAISKAKYIRDMNLGGWACYHIELDPDYKWSRQVIQIMNPRDVLDPKKDKTNTLLDK